MADSSVEYLTRTVDRNRYFYGKLMTVRDFLREQEYFNSKRWLINRLLFGSGVVCGLEVAAVPAEGKTVIEVQRGLAFDPLGREITVSERGQHDLAKSVTEDLKKTLPSGGTGVFDMLVCLEYHECPKEPVPSLGGSPCEESCESNRVGETYTVSLMLAPPKEKAPFPCERWLNRQTVARQTNDFQVERVAPVFVRQGEVFEVALKVTARKDVTNVTLSETVTGGLIIEPNPNPPPQFPTTPVSLRKGEFFIYVYQVQPADGASEVNLSGGAGVPSDPAKVLVLDKTQADAREAEMNLGACPDDTADDCVPVARINATFDAGALKEVALVGDYYRPRFRYSLTRTAELLDCVRASLRAQEDSPRPGHLFITFKDLERNDLQPIGPAADHGKAWTVPRGDHVHALLLYNNSGLQFEGNQLRIEGNVGGERINFLNPVSGQDPVEPQHLTTKHYVDARIAGLDWQESVRDKDLVSPPPPAASPAPPYEEGARYLIPGNPGDPSKTLPKNPWNKHPGEIATWNGKDWDFTKPDEGTAVFVDDENIAYLFVEGKWIPFLATPEVAAGDGLRADGAVLSVGQGAGLKVNPNDVEVIYDPNNPRPVGPKPSPGASNTSSRGDHTHELPLAFNSGLAFGGLLINPRALADAKGLLTDDDRVRLTNGLRVEGVVGGVNIDFLHPVLGQTPVEPRHLATKQYVDGVAAGLDWQNSVLTAKRTAPPPAPAEGARYLVLSTGLIIRLPRVDESLRERLGVAGEILRPLPTEPEPSPAPLPEPEPLPKPLPEPDPIPPPPPDTDPLPLPGNPWRGHENSIATWDGKEWSFIVPNEGMAVFVEDENTAYLFVDGKWVPFMAMPEVAAGAGLYAEGARLSVGQGSGLIVSENGVDVAYHAGNPTPVGPSTFPGASAALARGDHTHELPLELSGGLEFVVGKVDEAKVDESVPQGEESLPEGTMRLRVNGRINGDAIEFLNPVLGQDPVAPRHLTTKQYVDGLVGGLTWQSTVLDKDLTKPPEEPGKGDRYLLFEKPASGTPWEGHQDNIATYTGKRWEFIVPLEGMAAFVADENLAYLYADGKWVQFLAPPAAVGAGAGLIQQGTDLAVGQGQGIVVTPDAVSVSFGGATMPVGTTASPGASRQVAQSDHTHPLLLAPSSGLEFVASSPAVSQLRIGGPVGSEAIDFLFPVLGRTPVAPRHLATKEYVDSKGGGGTVAAGDGLVNNANGISVGAGPGLAVNPDEVHVVFEDGEPQPLGEKSSPGASNTAARGDHTHAMPDVWGTSVATGVVAFNMRLAGKQSHIRSFAIDPGLGAGAICVVVGLESEVEGEGTFVGEVDHFEDAMLEGGGFRRFQSILLGAVITPPGITPTLATRGFKGTTFEIWAQATPRAEVLPDAFRVRWWAYKAGRDQGVIDYTPPDNRIDISPPPPTDR